MRRETGWHVGADGKWRFEISDADARLTDEAWARVTDESGSNLIRLGDALEHPALFAAYPAVADYAVLFVDGQLGAADGSFSDGVITLERGQSNIVSTLLHEIQHGIQSVEGFASGGNPRGAYNAPNFDLYRRLAGEVEARNTQTRQRMTDAERRATPPGQTADVPDPDVIVTFNGKDMASAPTPANAAPSRHGGVAATLSGQELGEFGDDTKALRKTAIAWYQDNLQGRPATHPTLGEVRFTKKGRDEVKSFSADPDKLKLVPALREIIERGEHVRTEPIDHPRKDGIKQFHIVQADVALDGATLRVQVDIAEDAFGNLFYDIFPDVDLHEQRKTAPVRLGQNPGSGAVKGGVSASLAPILDDGELNIKILDRDGARGKSRPATMTRDDIRQAAIDALPGMGRVVDEVLRRGEEGKAGGVVVVEDAGQLAETFADKTGRDMDDAVRLLGSDAEGNANGFYDPQSGLTFLVAPNLTAQTAPAVLLHEATHARQRADIDQRALALIEGRAKAMKPVRTFLDGVAARMEEAGETGNAEEATTYIVEEAVLQGRQAGFSAADGKLLSWIDRKLGKRVGNIVRDFVAMIRAWGLKRGMRVDPTVDDLVALAKSNLREMAAGKVEATGGKMAASMSDAEVRGLVEQYASTDGAPTEAEIRRAVREYRETERAYGGKDAWQRAKDAGKTKLNYRQWVQVRTPNFKKWFGDWEAVRAQQRLDTMKPVALQLPEHLRSAPLGLLRDAVKARLDALAESGATVTHQDIGDIGFGKGNNKKVVSTSATPQKLHAAHEVVSVIESSTHTGSALSAKPDEARHGVVYHTLATKVEAFGREFVALVTVKQSSDGARFYNNIAAQSGHEKAPAAYPGDRQDKVSGSATAFTGADSILLPTMRRVNPGTVSKVTDPATGEPMVVYHGTGWDFSAFDRAQGQRANVADGFNFAADPEYASAFAKRSTFDSAGGNVMPAFLNIRNPSITRSADTGAERAGHDGVIKVPSKGGTRFDNAAIFVAFHPTQIKSATGNIGTFSAAGKFPPVRARRPMTLLLLRTCALTLATRRWARGMLSM